MTVERFDVVAYGICLLMYHMMLLRWCALLSIMYAHISNGLQLQLSSTKIPTRLSPLSTFIYCLLNSFALDVPSETEKNKDEKRKRKKTHALLYPRLQHLHTQKMWSLSRTKNQAWLGWMMWIMHFFFWLTSPILHLLECTFLQTFAHTQLLFPRLCMTKAFLLPLSRRQRTKQFSI